VPAYWRSGISVRTGSNEQIPEGWMIDRQGLPLTDPKRAREGFLASIGGPKGYGLALMFGLLDGKSNGAASTWSTKGRCISWIR